MRVYSRAEWVCVVESWIGGSWRKEGMSYTKVLRLLRRIVCEFVCDYLYITCCLVSRWYWYVATLLFACVRVKGWKERYILYLWVFAATVLSRAASACGKRPSKERPIDLSRTTIGITKPTHVSSSIPSHSISWYAGASFHTQWIFINTYMYVCTRVGPVSIYRHFSRTWLYSQHHKTCLDICVLFWISVPCNLCVLASK